MSDESQRLADGRYELFEAIGSGGMATVYRAQDHRLGVARAIKVLLPAYASKDRVRARFEAEARTMAILDHPNIVRVYDVGATTNTAWIVMELVEGSSMLTHIGDFGMGIEDCLNVGAKILAALDAAHQHGIVHRDIKPHNVLMSNDGIVRITDFGIARSAGISEDSLTKTGTVMGTWAFMAPEQRVNAKSVDHTADIYGAGATLFAMATGQTPMDLFAADLDPDMLAKVPDPLIPLIRQATRYNREERFTTARAMLNAIEAIREDLGIQTQSVPHTPVRAAPEAAPTTAPQPDSAAGSTPAKTPDAERPTENSRSEAMPASITYVDTDPIVPSPDDTRPDPHATAVPYRPNPTPASQVGPAQAATRRRLRDRLVATVAVVLIAGLAYGGFKKRSSSLDEPGSDSPAAEAPPLQTVAPYRTSSGQETQPSSAAGDASKAENAAPQSALPSQQPTEAQGIRPKPAALQAPEALAVDPEDAENTAPTVEPAADPPQAEIKSDIGSSASLGPPEIEHTPPTTARMNSRLPLSVQIANLTPLETQSYGVRVYYRASGTAKYSTQALSRTRRTWSGSIPIGSDMELGVEYFIKASASDPTADRLIPLKSGRNNAPHRVRVSSP